MVLDERQIDDVWGNGPVASTLGSEALDPATEAALVREWEPRALRIARYISRRFPGSAEQGDLDQIARLGLLQAARRFDPRRNCRFSTYVYHTIAGHLLHYLRDHTPALRIPRRWFDLRPRLERLAAELLQVLEREPTVLELAGRLGVSEEEVAGALGAEEFSRPASLDAIWEGPDGEGHGTLAGQIGVQDPVLETLERRLALQQLLTALPERLRHLIRLRYFQGQSQQEVGRRLGISQMQVSRLERQALASLRGDLRRAASAAGETSLPEAFR
jgi:RNA polymerase sigma-B factor